MNWLFKERKGTSFHIMSKKDHKFKRKFTFGIPKFKFQNGLEQKTSYFWAFLRQTGLWEPNPKKNVQVIVQILNPVNDGEIWAPQLLSGQTEKGGVTFFLLHTFVMLMW